MTQAEKESYRRFKDNQCDLDNLMLEEGARGRAKGHAEGHAKGKADGKAEIAKELKLDGMPAEKIAKITGLSVDEVNNL
jgi:predicted transposase/invertase (TIGR01784 family)